METKVVSTIVALLIILGFGGYSIASVNNVQTQRCTIINKESVSKGSDGHEYRVYTEECGTLVVSDSLLKGRFDSADDYAKIEAGHEYEVTTIGFRIPFFSQFPNIIEAK